MQGDSVALYTKKQVYTKDPFFFLVNHTSARAIDVQPKGPLTFCRLQHRPGEEFLKSVGKNENNRILPTRMSVKTATFENLPANMTGEASDFLWESSFLSVKRKKLEFYRRLCR